MEIEGDSLSEARASRGEIEKADARGRIERLGRSARKRCRISSLGELDLDAAQWAEAIELANRFRRALHRPEDELDIGLALRNRKIDADARRRRFIGDQPHVIGERCVARCIGAIVENCGASTGAPSSSGAAVAPNSNRATASAGTPRATVAAIASRASNAT
jgi:hypothetical protein